MKYIFASLIFFINVSMFAQNNDNYKPFSIFHFSILGGANFNTIPTMGGTLQFEAKTSLNAKINLKLSVGYSSIFKNEESIIKSYSSFKINNDKGYYLTTYSIDKVQYSVIPINLGIEYIFTKSKITPFAVLEFGYSFYSSEKQISGGGSGGGVYQSLDDIPQEFRNPAPKTIDGSGIDGAAGLGLAYKLSSSLQFNIRYLYNYFHGIANANQILVGITY